MDTPPKLPSNAEKYNIIMERFLESVTSGFISPELAICCVLSLFGRHVKGSSSIASYMRTQLTYRFKHIGFKEAHLCELAQTQILKERFGRSFDAQRRHQLRVTNLHATMHLQAESDEEMCGDFNNTLVTPPRPTTFDFDEVVFIQAIGELEPCHDANDGGIELNNAHHIVLSLGVKCNDKSKEISENAEIVLIVYDKYTQVPKNSTLSPPASAPASKMSMRHRRNCLPDSDEESEQNVTAGGSGPSVRRKLFGNSKSESPVTLPRETPTEATKTSTAISPVAQDSDSESEIASDAHKTRKRVHEHSPRSIRSKRNGNGGWMRL